DQAGLIVRCNAAFQSLIGRAPVSLHDAPADLCQLLAWEASGPHPELRPDAPTQEVRATVALPGGRVLRLRSRLRAFRTDAAAAMRVMAVVEDRSLEDERDLARLEMGALMDTAGIGVATYESSRGWLPASEGGESRPALPGGLQAIGREQVELASRAEFDRLQSALREGKRAQVRYAVVSPEHGTRWLLTRVEPGQLAGGRTALSVVTLDITDQEEVHRRSELMFNLSDVGIAFVHGGRIARGNEALARLIGSDSLVDLPMAALLGEAEARDVLLAPARPGAERARRFAGERRLRRRDGGTPWVQISTRCVDEADPEAGLICSFVDIDERRGAREAMQLQAERTRAILDSVLVGIVTVGASGIEWMNRSARRMFGGELADFVGEPIAIVATPEPDHPLRATHYLAALTEGQAETFERKLRGRDGREFWVVGNAVVTGREASGSQITFALLDIERRRQAEMSIAQAQASLQRIIETAPLAITLFDGAAQRVLRLNQMAALFFGRPVEQLLGRALPDILAPDDGQQLSADLRLAVAQADVLRRELHRNSRADGTGETRAWDVRIVALGSAGLDSETQQQLLLVASDVTEQRAAEQARFEAAVSQREMLVKEVHHRIKNNLQGVAGLLQQTATRRPEVAALISEAVGQVQAIAQVHGLQVGGTGPLRVKPLVEAIVQSVQRTFGRAIEVAAEGEPAHRYALPEGEAIPIALTINELLTNAIKHGAPGTIRCVMGFEPQRLAITIVNPGQLREGFSLAQVAPGVSGLGLVRALLPRRTATLTLTAQQDTVQAQVLLVPPSISLLDPL
ncbi:MAG: PAS domain S-box protein, partial [Burkholderiales bacterium]|nr:PAS domain S-box protein [Burkholderiales bacterium]